MVHMWLMTPNTKSIVKTKCDDKKDRDYKKYFPNGFETMCVENPKGVSKEFVSDNYTIIFDADDTGRYNPSAVWISKFLQIPPTGNFIIIRNVYIREKEDFEVRDIDITPRDFHDHMKKLTQ